jgi:hypothetical protein
MNPDSGGSRISLEAPEISNALRARMALADGPAEPRPSVAGVLQLPDARREDCGIGLRRGSV